MCSHLIYQPPINPFHRTHYLKINDLIYASLTIKGILRASAYFESSEIKASIERKGFISIDSFSINKINHIGKVHVADYNFNDIRKLPSGMISFSSGEEFEIKMTQLNCYDLILGSTTIACFDTIMPNSIFERRRLLVNVRNPRSDEVEISIFALWYMMITVGMGLNDG